MFVKFYNIELRTKYRSIKRCCPVCAHLLTQFKTRDNKRFVTTGQHTTISQCSLPEGLPVEVMRNMIKHFGDKLRRELVELQERTEVLRHRTISTDTRRMSLDSMDLGKEFSNGHVAFEAFEYVDSEL
jgi:hypothetical protein